MSFSTMGKGKRKVEPDRFCAACGRRKKAHPVYGTRHDDVRAVLCQDFVSLEKLRHGARPRSGGFNHG